MELSGYERSRGLPGEGVQEVAGNLGLRLRGKQAAEVDAMDPGGVRSIGRGKVLALEYRQHLKFQVSRRRWGRHQDGNMEKGWIWGQVPRELDPSKEAESHGLWAKR